jgi:hypothetical protein
MRRYRLEEDGMKIVADESRAEATDDNICCDYGREGPVCGPDVHPCQRGEDCAAACSEGAVVDEVGDEAEEGVDYVGYFTVFLKHDFFTC